jgi:hypothetical protein
MVHDPLWPFTISDKTWRAGGRFPDADLPLPGNVPRSKASMMASWT